MGVQRPRCALIPRCITLGMFACAQLLRVAGGQETLLGASKDISVEERSFRGAAHHMVGLTSTLAVATSYYLRTTVQQTAQLAHCLHPAPETLDFSF